MLDINNWKNLINEITKRKDGAFPKLLVKINKFLATSRKKNESTFDHQTVLKNHQDVFDNFKLIYEQLLLEYDATDIYVDIPSLKDMNNNLFFSMIGIGKWIRIHSGNVSRIFFLMKKKQ